MCRLESFTDVATFLLRDIKGCAHECSVNCSCCLLHWDILMGWPMGMCQKNPSDEYIFIAASSANSNYTCLPTEDEEQHDPMQRQQLSLN